MSASPLTPRALPLAIATLWLGAASLTAGCGSLAVGDKAFGCQGRPSDPLCLPTSQVYALTHGAEAPATAAAETDPPARATSRRDADRESAFGWAAPTPVAKRAGRPSSAPTADTDRPPSAGAVEDLLLPRSPDPIPLRMPAQVMRIWLAPWEDRQSDLHASGYVFTEIAPKTWTLAAGPDRFSQALLKPLQIEQRAPATGASPSPSPGSPGTASRRP